jgi:hypothetical protein
LLFYLSLLSSILLLYLILIYLFDNLNNNGNYTNSNFLQNSYAIEEVYIKRLINIRENEAKKLAFININQSYHIND